ncbi:MAG: hypothetical protein ACXADB_03735 [Candidatus Hermodarchaeia archaeon]
MKIGDADMGIIKDPFSHIPSASLWAEALEKFGRMVALAGSHATQLLAILLVSAPRQSPNTSI